MCKGYKNVCLWKSPRGAWGGGGVRLACSLIINSFFFAFLVQKENMMKLKILLRLLVVITFSYTVTGRVVFVAVPYNFEIDENLPPGSNVEGHVRYLFMFLNLLLLLL